MGNKNGTTQESSPVSPDKPGTREKLEKAFLQLKLNEEAAPEYLSRNHFKDVLFADFVDYGGLIYDYMRTAVGAEQDLTKEHYITVGEDIVQSQGTPQLELYFQVFSHGQANLTKPDGSRLLRVCYTGTWFCAGLRVDDVTEGDTFWQGMLDSMFAKEESISCGDFVYWCGRHCPRLFQGLHLYTTTVILGNASAFQQNEAKALPESVERLQKGASVFCLASLWAVSCSLPLYYIPAGLGHHTLEEGTVPLCDIVAQSGWCILYNSNDQGLSLNRFRHHVFDYKGPTVTMLDFPGFTFCIAADEEWKESNQRWGSTDCCLIQILPQYRTIQAGAGMLYLNIQDRNVPKGIQIGKDARSLVLEIDEGLSKVKYYGIEYDLHRLEVWGCGGPGLLKDQLNQKQWEHKEAEKSKDRKLNMDDWQDSPDRQILELGGVKTEHAEH